MTNPNVMAIATMFAQLSGQDAPVSSQQPSWDQEEAMLTSAYGADAFMARSRISGAIELNNEVVELRRGVTSLWVGHEVVQNFPNLFFIPTIEHEPEPPAPAPGPSICWTDQQRQRAHWTLGRRHGDRRRRST
jgi:hypothetical protein